ncbi:MAG: IPT/TIG domain-containing protein [Bacteroidota bacterium]
MKKAASKIGNYQSIILAACLMVMGCSDDGGEQPMVDDGPINVSPTISTISPTSGLIGTEVTISGTNFSTTNLENVISFNGTTTAPKSATASQLVVDVPENANSGVVSVTVNGEQANGPTFEVITANASLCDESTIMENTTWENVVSGDEIDYVVDCAISVVGNALLTIEPGVIIAFEGQESGIFTNEGGGIKAIGTQENPIHLIGASENRGVWKGIYFGSNHPENKLEYVTVKHAGRSASGQSNEKGAVQLSRGEDSKASIVHCTIEENDGYGLVITDEAELDEFSNNTIRNNQQAPVILFFNQLGSLDKASDYQGNDTNYIEVRENEIENNAVQIPAINVNYRFVESKKYNINNDVTIEEGTTMEFTNGAGLRLGEQSSDCATATGSLNAAGTLENPITFQGVTEGRGTWLGLGFNSSSPNNKLMYCEISGGGSDKLYNASDFSANITLQCQSRLIIQNTTISDSGEYGIYVLDLDAELVDFRENSIINNASAPIWIHFPQVDQLDSNSSYAEGNEMPYIQVQGDAIKDADLTIKKIGVPYRIETDNAGRETYVEKEVTMEPGVILEFEPGAGLVLGSPGVDCIPVTGSLNAVGSMDEPIIFKGSSEGQGTWLGIGINSSTSANLMEYCLISGGGSSQMYNAGGQGNIVLHCQGSLTIENSSIEDSGGWGIDFVQDGNNLTQMNNTLSNNALGNIASN